MKLTVITDSPINPDDPSFDGSRCVIGYLTDVPEHLRSDLVALETVLDNHYMADWESVKVRPGLKSDRIYVRLLAF